MLKSRRNFIKTLLGTLLLLAISLVVFVYYLFNTPALKLQSDVQYQLKSGINSEQLSNDLYTKHQLKYPKIFNLLSKRMHLEENMKKGRYHIKTEMNLIQ